MSHELWVNVPVKDVEKSKEFFYNIGFSIDTEHASPVCVGLKFGAHNFMVMLFEENTFKSFTKTNLTDTKESSEVMFSFSAGSKEEVDEMAQKVKAAGGTVFAEPEEIQGWMYGFAFTDLDGHRWNQLYMDKSRMGGEK